MKMISLKFVAPIQAAAAAASSTKFSVPLAGALWSVTSLSLSLSNTHTHTHPHTHPPTHTHINTHAHRHTGANMAEESSFVPPHLQIGIKL